MTLPDRRDQCAGARRDANVGRAVGVHGAALRLSTTTAGKPARETGRGGGVPELIVREASHMERAPRCRRDTMRITIALQRPARNGSAHAAPTRL